MKTIKVRFVDTIENTKENCYGKIEGNNTNRNYIREALKKNYILDESSYPDYVFTYVPVGGSKGYEYYNYKDAVIIFVQNENVFPNFYCYDYAIGGDHALKYGNRYFYRDSMLGASVTYHAYDRMLTKHEVVAPAMAKRKFCGMVVSNLYNAAPERERMFHLLSSYKKVESGGAALNNVGGRVKDKLEFESRHKFTIAFDNVENGIVQEKIGMAFAAGTVPIYWGNPNVTEIYNERAFINCHAFDSFEDVLAKVKEIDEDDEKYLAMLREPAMLHPIPKEECDESLACWLKGIIEEPKEKAIKRRPEYWSGIAQEMQAEGYKRLYRQRKRRDMQMSILHTLYSPFKKLGLGKEARDFMMRIIYKAPV